MTDAGDLKAPPPDAPSNDRRHAPNGRTATAASTRRKKPSGTPPTDRKTKPSARLACRVKTCCAGSTSAISKTTCAASLQWTTTSAACLRYLDESGLAANTIVIYNSDQGFYLGEHGWFDKRWMYKESLRTPLLARWPGVIAPGSTNRDLVSNLDLAETFLEIAGAAVPPDMQGRSLVPVMKGETPQDWRKTFYYHYYESMTAHGVPAHEGVRNARYKLIRFYESNEWELFDTEADPSELDSIYGEKGSEKIAAALKARVAAPAGAVPRRRAAPVAGRLPGLRKVALAALPIPAATGGNGLRRGCGSVRPAVRAPWLRGLSARLRRSRGSSLKR